MTDDKGRMPDNTSRPRRALLVVNARARSGDAALDAPLGVLAEAGIEVTRHPATAHDRIDDVIRARAHEGFDCVLVGGGDGTMNAAAPGLVDTGLPLGILPLGTANDLARSLAIPPDPAAAAAIVAAGHRRPIDLGEVNGRYFFNVASIGFSAALPREMSAESKRRWGVLGYAVAAARLLHRMRPFTAWIDHDGRTDRTRGIQISVGNGRHYGGGMTVESNARPDDGMLDVYSLETDRWWRLLGLLPYLRAGTQGVWDDVATWRTAGCTVRTRRSMPVNADGEIAARTPAKFRVIPGAVTIFSPLESNVP
ncbi:MAG: lipid kinase [Alphaproteobacteria bacterium]